MPEFPTTCSEALGTNRQTIGDRDLARVPEIHLPSHRSRSARCCWETSAPARVYVVETLTKFRQAAESPQTLNYIGDAAL
jgi:hypothetical protein